MTKKIISKFKHNPGLHSSTTAFSNLLGYYDIQLSEPICFGIGEGLGFMFRKFPSSEFPVICGYSSELEKKISKNLDLVVSETETTSDKKAWLDLKINIDNEIPVMLKLDSSFLDYCENSLFPSYRYAIAVGYDHDFVYLSDTENRTIRKTKLENLQKARNSQRRPFPPKNYRLVLKEKPANIDLKNVIRQSILGNAKEIMNPKTKFYGMKGLRLFCEHVRFLCHKLKFEEHFKNLANSLESFGTNGFNYRTLYVSFLTEASEYIKLKRSSSIISNFERSSRLWKSVTEQVRETISNQKYLKEYISSITDGIDKIIEVEHNAWIELKSLLA